MPRTESVRLPIPVSVITGFLGAGKTTLVNRLLKDPALTDTAVIVNEFGEISIDHLLVEQSGDGVIQLADGCLCCSARGELVDTLIDLLERLQDGRIERLSRVVIETTGLADPAPVLQSIMAHPALLDAFRLDGVITVIDALNGATTLGEHVEALKQAGMADRLVLTKLDIAEAEQRSPELRARLRQINPNAPVLDVRDQRTGAAALIKCGLYDPETKTADVARWLGEAAAQGHAAHQPRPHDPHVHASAGHDHGETRHGAHDHGRHQHAAHPSHAHLHHERVRSFSLVHDRPLPFAAVETFLHLLRSTFGDRLLRLKGIIELAEDPAHPLVVHGVQKTFHPPVALRAWPDAVRGARMVLIGIDLPEDYVRRLFAAITGEPAIDMPDRAALEHNPLAIAGS